MEGTEFIFTSPPPPGTQCPICLQVWRDPIMFMPCEHVACRNCVAKVDACPECRGPVDAKQNPPRALLRVVDSLPVHCLRCMYEGVFEGVAKHECERLPLGVVARRRGVKFAARGEHELALKELRRGMEALHEMARAQGFSTPADLPEHVVDEMHAVELAIALARTTGAEPQEATKAAILAATLNGTHPDALDTCAKLLHTHGGPAKADDAKAYATRAVKNAMDAKYDTPFSFELLNPGAGEETAKKKKPATAKKETRAAAGRNTHVDPTEAGLPGSQQLPPEAHVTGSKAEQFRQQEADTDAKLDRLCKNMYALAAYQWAAVGSNLAGHVKALPDGGNEALSFIRNGLPVVVPRRGATTSEDGEDVADVAHRCAELNLKTLAEANGEGLVALVKSVLEAGSWREALMVSVRDIMQCVDDESAGGPRRLWLLRTHPKHADQSAIVDSTTGKSVDDQVQFKGHSDSEFQEFMMRMQTNRANHVFIPRYARIHALERTRLILDAALGWMSAFATDPSAPPERLREYKSKNWRSPAFALGCVRCGSRPANTVCKECECARYCSNRCLKEDASAHEPVCSRAAVLRPEQLQAKVRSMIPNLVNDPQFKVVKELCDWKKNAADAYGDGDQTSLGPVRDARGKPHQFRQMRSEGLDFNPATMSTFMQDCFFGDLAAVKRGIAECGGDAEIIRKLVNKRESLMRMSPLLGAICGAKLVGAFMASRVPNPDFEGVVELLIKHGSKADAKDVLGFSSVHHAAAGNCSEKSLQLLPLLVENGADPNVRNRIEELAMSESVIANRPEACRALIQVGADPTEPATFAMMFPEVRETIMKCGPLRGLKAGDQVIIKGLVKSPALNGKTAVVQDVRHKLGRYTVLPEGRDDPVNIKMENLVRGGEGHLCAKCSKPASQRCSTCKGVVYCSRECQVAHWKAHKADCSRLKATAAPSMVVPKMVEKDYSMDMFDAMAGGKVRAPTNDAQTKLKGKQFIVKCQIPLEMPSMRPAKSGAVAIYDEKKFFWWTVKPEGAWAEVNARLMSEVAKVGPKAYFTAKFRDNGDLEIMLPPTGMQPW